MVLLRKFADISGSEIRKEGLPAIILIVVILTFFARGQAIFNPLYAIDTYSFVDTSSEGSWYNQMFEQGRHGFALLWWLGKNFDFAHFDDAVFNYASAIILMAISGVMLSIVALNRISKSYSLLFTLVFCLHPFMNELFHFADGTLMFSLAMFFSAAGLITSRNCWKTKSRPLIGALCVAFALSIYQTVLGYVIVAALMSAVNAICQGGKRLELSTYYTAMRHIGVIILGTAIYLVFITVMNRLLDVHLTSRFDPGSFVHLKQKLEAIHQAIRLCLWSDFTYTTKAEEVLLIFCLITAIYIVFRRSYRSEGIFGFLAVALLTLVALIVSTSLTIVSKDVWLVPRTLSGFSVFSAAVIANGWFYSSRARRFCLGVSVSVLVISYIGIANRTIHDQALVNRWDLAEANRIIERLEQNSKFNDVRSLALVGGSWARTLPVSSVWGDMNISAFGASWAKIGVIEQATGMKFDTPSASDFEEAINYCRGNNVWPALNSTSVQGGLGIVCLTKPS